MPVYRVSGPLFPDGAWAYELVSECRRGPCGDPDDQPDSDHLAHNGSEQNYERDGPHG